MISQANTRNSQRCSVSATTGLPRSCHSTGFLVANPRQQTQRFGIFRGVRQQKLQHTPGHFVSERPIDHKLKDNADPHCLVIEESVGLTVGCHSGQVGRGGRSRYVFHLTCVTSNGVPVRELIQPLVVRRHGHCSVYGAPPTVCYLQWDVSSSGAVSIRFQPKSRGGRIMSSSSKRCCGGHRPAMDRCRTPRQHQGAADTRSSPGVELD
jgi:hypothetical protein